MSSSSSTSAPEIVCIGETMALFRSESFGPLTHSRSMALGIGGSESNVAIGLARLGARATWIGMVGADSLGELIVHEIRAEDVTVIAPRHPTAPTGLMIKERRTPATQQVSYYRTGSAGSGIRPHNVPAGVIEQTRILHVTGITPALSPSAAATIESAIQIARGNGALVSFDVNYRASLWQDRDVGSTLRSFVESADIVFAGLEEAALVVGEGEPADVANRLAGIGPGEVVIKLGSAGAIALTGGVLLRRAAISVPVVDTVGAGDAFVAGYLAELLAGAQPDRRLAMAVKTGAFACMVPGDWEGLPRRADLPLLDAGETVSR